MTNRCDSALVAGTHGQAGGEKEDGEITPGIPSGPEPAQCVPTLEEDTIDVIVTIGERPACGTVTMCYAEEARKLGLEQLERDLYNSQNELLALNDDEHTKNARPSTKGKHEKGITRKLNKEKGDKNRRSPSKRPKNWPGGPYPPKIRLPFLPFLLIPEGQLRWQMMCGPNFNNGSIPMECYGGLDIMA